jgi:hypothetical protein
MSGAANPLNALLFSNMIIPPSTIRSKSPLWFRHEPFSMNARAERVEVSAASAWLILS